jgi:hypothetical protein
VLVGFGTGSAGGGGGGSGSGGNWDDFVCCSEAAMPETAPVSVRNTFFQFPFALKLIQLQSSSF